MNDIIALFKNPFFYGISPVIGVIACWILSHIFPSFVKFNFDYRLENFRRKLLHKDKASIISDLLVLLQHDATSQCDVDKINKHLFDLCLYLPPCLIHKLAHTICKTKDTQNIGPYELLVQIRSFIEGTYSVDKAVKLSGDNIPHYTYTAKTQQAKPTNI